MNRRKYIWAHDLAFLLYALAESNPALISDSQSRLGDKKDMIQEWIWIVRLDDDSAMMMCDHLMLLDNGAEQPMENVLLTLDGGAGEDFAVAGALVQVVNCEHVEQM